MLKEGEKGNPSPREVRMASSPGLEIEIASDSNPEQKHNPSNFDPAAAAVNDYVIDVFSASAYGDLLKLRRFVEKEKASLSNPDGNGYYALQWASLNNYSDIVQYIIEVDYTWFKISRV